MNTVGRGRGWLHGEPDPVPTRRPGGLGDRDLCALLASKVSALDVNGPSLPSDLGSFLEDLQLHCRDKDSLNSIVKQLHDRSLEDRQFGIKAAKAFAAASMFEVDDTKLRVSVLCCVQKDFEERSQLQTSNNAKFLNSVALMGEVFRSMRLPGDMPIHILVEPLLEYQDMLLAGDEHELEVFTSQLAVNGKALREREPAKMAVLMRRVRTTLMSRNLCGRSRCWLLVALDLEAVQYGQLPGDLLEYYQVHLGPSMLSQLLRVNVNQLPSPVPQDDVPKRFPPAVAPPSKRFPPASPISNGTPTIVPFRENLKTAKNVSPKEAKESMPVARRESSKFPSSANYPPRRSGERRWEEGETLESDRAAWGISQPRRTGAYEPEHDDRLSKNYDGGSARARVTSERNWREKKQEDSSSKLDGRNTYSRTNSKKENSPSNVSLPNDSEESWD
ncbi:uncharacterized protein LOC134528168 [Bacillus rossius redtenbacheri]|uniref:uncharacterized protein LOC134528168 n=1 Tax=Bacillus rossius redtenbacheri TaxID=93214 RepID=UPI002FDE9403